MVELSARVRISSTQYTAKQLDQIKLSNKNWYEFLIKALNWQDSLREWYLTALMSFCLRIGMTLL